MSILKIRVSNIWESSDLAENLMLNHHFGNVTGSVYPKNQTIAHDNGCVPNTSWTGLSWSAFITCSTTSLKMGKDPCFNFEKMSCPLTLTSKDAGNIDH